MPKTERRVCKISGAGWGKGCLAPAGVGIQGVGYAEGDGSCRGTCCHCGEPVCGLCSKVVRQRGKRIRLCEDCYEDPTRLP